MIVDYLENPDRRHSVGIDPAIVTARHRVAAYPLSKTVRAFRSRTVYVWMIFFTMLFTDGLIPTYMLIQQLGMLDSIWSLVLPPPFGVPVFNVLILLNFFRNIPTELEEAAFMDGASHWTILGRIYIPTLMAALATLTLFVAVRHWKSWLCTPTCSATSHTAWCSVASKADLLSSNVLPRFPVPRTLKTCVRSAGTSDRRARDALIILHRVRLDAVAHHT